MAGFFDANCMLFYGGGYSTHSKRLKWILILGSNLLYYLSYTRSSKIIRTIMVIIYFIITIILCGEGVWSTPPPQQSHPSKEAKQWAASATSSCEANVRSTLVSPVIHYCIVRRIICSAPLIEARKEDHER